jgi:tetratricopeptide (TPR) repeat protein
LRGARGWVALVVAVAAVVAWRALPRAAEVVEPAVVVVQPVLERGERRAAVVEESQRPEDPWTKKNKQAIGLLGEGELERAVALFRECVAAVPGEAVFRSNLAEALARLARVEYELVATRARAIELLEEALQLAPEREDLAALLAKWIATAEVEGEFWVDRSAHFRLSYDGDRDELLGSGYDLVLKTLEDAYAEFAALFGVRPAEGGSPRIEVVLLERSEFDALTGLGHWAGGAYDGRIRVPVTDLEQERRGLVRVLRHELVHAFVREKGGRAVPGWLNEGLAEWLEEPAGASRERAVERARKSAGAGPMRSLDELGGSLAALGGVDEIRAAYAQSIALVSWIEHWYGERVLFEMVGGCREGVGVGASFLARTRVDLGQALRDLGQDLENQGK